jgi:hypothetical protein
VISVTPGDGSLGSQGEGNTLDSITVSVCDVVVPSGSTADILLRAPSGQKVLLTGGLSTIVPVDIVVVPLPVFTKLVGVSGLGEPALARARHPKPVMVGRAKAALLRHKVAKLLGRGSTRVAGQSALATVPAPLCVSGPLEIVPAGDTGVSLPWPAPPAPYGSDLGALIGTNPQGDWKLYVATKTAPTDLRSATAYTPVSAGAISGWILTLCSHDVAPVTSPFNDDSTFTITGDGAGTPLSFAMHVQHSDGQLVTPTGQVDFIECTTPLCDGNSVGTAPLVPDQIGKSTATLVLPTGSVSPPGQHTYKAVYFGDANFGMLVADPVSVTVAP